MRAGSALKEPLALFGRLCSGAALAKALRESALCGFHALRFREHDVGAGFELFCRLLRRGGSLCECWIGHIGLC